MNILVRYQMIYNITFQENQNTKHIKLEANDILELEKLKQYPKNIISIKTNRTIKDFVSFLVKPKIKQKDIYELFNQLKIMLNANITINESISLLLQNKQIKYIEDMLLILDSSIKTAQPIDIALAKYKKNLGETTILFLKLGISNGNIKEAVNSIVEINTQNKQIENKLSDIIRYPIILLISLLVAIVMIFIYVIPNFQYIFTLLGDNLPFTTKALLYLENIVLNYYYFIALLPFVIYILSILIYKKNRLYFDKLFILKIPIVSKLLRAYMFYKLFLSINIIVNSKYKFQVAIENSKNIIDNLYLKDNINKILIDIKNGSSIANAFKNRDIFDQLTIKLLYAAQHTNQYETILKDISKLHKTYFDNRIKIFASILEPAIIFFIALIVLWLVLAVMTPMWEMSSIIS
ncbi:MAG: type II secretion system F family protein [Campylobacterota bacterium]|nr:type II secretion system F family protein [Campylobacterota bacterium]